jgi:hypothetical protein
MVKNTKNHNLSKDLMGGYTQYFNKIIRGDMAKKIQRTKKLLDSFDATNNGVIYTTKKTRKGGANKTPLNTCAILGYSDKALDICNNKLLVNDFKMLRNTIEDINKNKYINVKDIIYSKFNRSECKNKNVHELRNIDDIILEFYYNNRKLPDHTNMGFTVSHEQILGPDLKKYIDSKINNGEQQINILKYDDHGKYKISDLTEVGKRNKSHTNQEGTKNWIQDFSHAGYNKEIVQAYEKKYIENINNLPLFMEKQYEFMASMNITDKIIINDYTKKSCFHFYSAYAGKMINDANLKKYIIPKTGIWVNEYTADYVDEHNNNVGTFCFGDSFFKQIFDVIEKDNFNTKIKETLSEDLLKKYKDVDNIEEYWNFLSVNDVDRAKPNSLSIFKDLENEDWDLVMRTFIIDINNIIARAPECKTDIYCYRAVGFDYIQLHNADDTLDIGGPNIYRINEGTYINTRIGSLSLNFDSSERYLGIDPTTKQKTGTMYRAVINTGVKVLYIPSLSYASDEFEILHASYGIFVDKKDNYKCYNNKKNKYGILSYEQDQFNSALVGLAGYSANIQSDTFEVIGAKLTDALKNNKTSIRSLYNKYLDNKVDGDKTNRKVQEIVAQSKETLVNNDDTLDNDVENLKKYIEQLEAVDKSGGKKGGKRGGKKK